MILNISLQNYRAFKDKVNFSMIAESSKSKGENIFVQSIGKDDNVRLLKTSLIFGANASGKSTMLRALFEILKFVVRENEKDKISAGEEIKAFSPFKFSSENKNSPIEFIIDFIGKDSVKYRYELIFNDKNIIKESLENYPNNKKMVLFQREISDNEELLKHTGYIGSISKNKKIDLFHNQTMLSKYGTDIPDETISDIYIYLKNINIINATNYYMLRSSKKEIKKITEKNPNMMNKISELIKLADTGLNKVSLNETNEESFNFSDGFPDDLKTKVIQDNKYKLTGFHNYYEKNILKHNDEPLAFEDESHGTQTLFSIGGKLIQVLEKGSPIFIDELDTSLHPFLTKLLISLFQNKEINNKNAQLIFTTHDTSLLDRRLFRKDQIWFTEKDKTGKAELYSLQDFPDVREDTPFDKWYLAGKFGALPNIKSLENIFK